MANPGNKAANAARAEKSRQRLIEALEMPTVDEAAAHFCRNRTLLKHQREGLRKGANRYGLIDVYHAKFGEALAKERKEKARAGSAAANKIKKEKGLAKGLATVEDAEFLADHGVHMAEALKRLNYSSEDALYRRLHQFGRSDIFSKLLSNDRLSEFWDADTKDRWAW